MTMLEKSLRKRLFLEKLRLWMLIFLYAFLHSTVSCSKVKGISICRASLNIEVNKPVDGLGRMLRST